MDFTGVGGLAGRGDGEGVRVREREKRRGEDGKRREEGRERELERTTVAGSSRRPICRHERRNKVSSSDIGEKM